MIFDLFDTLVPFSEDRHLDVLREMSRVLGLPDDPSTLEAWHLVYERQELGESIETAAQSVCQALDVQSGAETVRVAARIWMDFQRELLARPPRSIVDGLEELRREGLKTGLISNCPAEVPQLWESCDLATLIDVAVFSSVSRIRKPDCRIYHEACFRLDLEPGQCLYIGDGGSDELDGAERAGISAVMFSERPSGSSYKHAPDWGGAAIGARSDIVGLLGTSRES